MYFQTCIFFMLIYVFKYYFIKEGMKIIMKRTRVAGLIEIENGYALMHRKNVKKKEGTDAPYGEYYVFPGGGVEETDLSYEEAVKREVFEEFGINVEVVKKIFYRKINEDVEEYIYLCKYVSGTFGTGHGPEFSNDPQYADRGIYSPEIIAKEKIKDIRLIPEEFKERILEGLI